MEQTTFSKYDRIRSFLLEEALKPESRLKMPTVQELMRKFGASQSPVTRAIRDLERRLRQGKLSFASEQRMERYLGLRPGSVSPFGLINDTENHVHLFLDRNLRQQHSLSFHPNDNTGTIVIPQAEFIRYLDGCGNSYEFIDLY